MLSLLLTTLLPALIPVGTNAIKEATSKWLGSPGPRTFEETLKWEEAMVNKATALAKLDTIGGNPSQWVVDLRGSARYIVVYLIILWAAVAYMWHGLPALMIISQMDGSVDITPLGALVNSATFFLFGDRLFNNMAGKK